MQSTAEQPTATTTGAHGCVVDRRQRGAETRLLKRVPAKRPISGPSVAYGIKGTRRSGYTETLETDRW